MKKFMSDNGEVDSALIDGYHFGDRLLEGVLFIIKINSKGKFTAEIHPSGKAYFEDLNKKKWLKEAAAYAENEEIFLHPNYPRVKDDVWVEDDSAPTPQPKPVVAIKAVSFGDILKQIQLGKIK